MVSSKFQSKSDNFSQIPADDALLAKSIVEAVPSGVLILDDQYRVLVANDRAARAFGVRAPKHLVGQRLKVRVRPGASGADGIFHATLDRGGRGATAPVTLKTVPSASGPRVIVTCVENLAPGQSMAAPPLSLRDSLIFLADLFIVVDDGNRVVDCQGWETLRCGSCTQCIVNASVHDLFPAESGDALSEALAKARTGKRAECVVRMVGARGDVWLQMRAGPHRDEDGRRTGVALVARDITEMKRREESLLDQSYRDALTGVFNRRYLSERMSVEYLNARRYARPFCMAVGDLDYFKALNDTAGHQVGDKVLRIFAEALQDELRVDAVIARFGGDEFAILFPLTTAADAAEALKRVQRTLDRRCRRIGLTNGQVQTASFGVAEIADIDGDANDLFEAADRALYHAKKRGRQRIALRVPEPTPENEPSVGSINRTLTEIFLRPTFQDRYPS